MSQLNPFWCPKFLDKSIKFSDWLPFKRIHYLHCLKDIDIILPLMLLTVYIWSLFTMWQLIYDWQGFHSTCIGMVWHHVIFSCVIIVCIDLKKKYVVTKSAVKKIFFHYWQVYLSRRQVQFEFYSKNTSSINMKIKKIPNHFL